jgi:hypothetical protein
VTRAELLALLHPWRDRARRWGPLVACVVLALLTVRGCQATRAARAEAAQLRARSAGEAQAHAAGVPVVDQVDQRALDARAAALEHDNGTLRAERDRARKALGALRAHLVAHVEAAGAPVGGTAAPPQPERPVALYVGEQLRLGADLVVDELAGGAHVLSGSLDATGPRGLLLRQPFSAPVTVASQAGAAAPAAHAAASGWRWGPLGGWSGSGWLLGGLVATPEVRLPLIGSRTGFALNAAGGPGGVFVMAGPTF